MLPTLPPMYIRYICLKCILKWICRQLYFFLLYSPQQSTIAMWFIALLSTRMLSILFLLHDQITAQQLSLLCYNALRVDSMHMYTYVCKYICIYVHIYMLILLLIVIIFFLVQLNILEMAVSNKYYVEWEKKCCVFNFVYLLSKLLAACIDDVYEMLT